MTRGLGHAYSHASMRLSKKRLGRRWARPSVASALLQAHLADVGPGEQRGVDVDGVRRRGHQGAVAGTEQHPHEVREALLGPDGGHHLGLGVELHAEPAQVQRRRWPGAAWGCPCSTSTGGCWGLWTASASFSTAASGEGRSGLPKPRSMTSRPARRASSFSASMCAKTYGGSPLIRRNSIGKGYRPAVGPAPHARRARRRTLHARSLRRRARSAAASATASRDSGHAHTAQVAPGPATSDSHCGDLRDVAGHRARPGHLAPAAQRGHAPRAGPPTG